MSRATYKSPAQLVRLRKTLVLNSQTFCNWNALQLTAPSGTGQERAFKTHEGLVLGFFLWDFCSSSPEFERKPKLFKAFIKQTSKTKSPFQPPSERNTPDKQIALYQDASLVVKVPQAEQELEFGFLASPFFHIPGAHCGLNSTICCGRVQILLGENFMVWACWETVSKEGSIRMGVFLWKVWLSLYPLFLQKSVSGKAPLVLLSMDTQSCGSMGQKLRESKRSPGFLLCDGPNSLLV